jgi:hypothetical protein
MHNHGLYWISNPKQPKIRFSNWKKNLHQGTKASICTHHFVKMALASHTH